MKTIRKVLIVGLIGVIAFCGYNVMQIENEYRAEKLMHQSEMKFKPVENWMDEGESFINQGILDLQAQYPDAVGWLTVPYTGIDYPFVCAKDNNTYLHKDLDGNYSMAGSIFMDYRNNRDFSDFNTILYGHHMKNGSMFGTLKEFNNKNCFNTNKTGIVHLADRSYEVEFFAFLVVPVEDDIVFGIPDDKNAKEAYVTHIKKNARQYREEDINSTSQIITLSTCAYEFENARMVLLGKMTRIQ